MKLFISVFFLLVSMSFAGTITLDSIPVRMVGDPDYTLSASTTSGLSISYYTSSDTNVATVSPEGVLHVKKAGASLITAVQSGNSEWAADSAYQHLYVWPRKGSLFAWGYGASGQLGLGSTTNQTVPVEVTALADIVSVSSGGKHTLALKADGSVYSFGDNYYGQLGIGSYITQKTPIQITTLNNIVAVSAGYSHSLALDKKGIVYAWGESTYGQVGNGSNAEQKTPVVATAGALAIAAGDNHSLALDRMGFVYAWGSNGHGQLGNESTANRMSEVRVTGLTDVVAIAAGGAHSMALKKDGTVYVWGYNYYGQLGIGGTTDSDIPVQVPSLADIVAIAAGINHSVALARDGSVYVWGDNTDGQLGIGTTVNSETPVLVTGMTGKIVSIAGGGNHTLAITSDEQIYTWGRNNVGQIGNATKENQFSPVLLDNMEGIVWSEGGQLSSFAIVSTQKAQIITFPEMTTQTYGNADFDAGATASSGLAVSYSSSDTNVVKIISGLLHIQGAGNVSITAKQAGNGEWAPATPVLKSLIVSPKEIAVTARDTSKTAGKEDPVLPYDADPLVGNDSWSGALERAEGESPATYSITLGTLSAGTNYSIQFTGALFTIKELPTSLFAAKEKSALTRIDQNILFTQGIQGWIAIYTTAGQKVRSIYVNGDGAYPLDLAKGIYRIKIQDVR